MNYRIKIKAPNKMFIINNKPVRSPFECFINEDALILIKSRIKFYGLSNIEYEVELLNNSIEEERDYSQTSLPKKKEKPKELQDKPKRKTSAVVKIKNDSQNIGEPKQKVFNKEEKLFYQPQEIIKQKKEKKSAESLEKIEQIINIQNDQFMKNDNEISNVEVTIEELTTKSSTILEKFLKSEF